MHVGYVPTMQNPGQRLSDAEVFRQELRLADMVEPLGFDSLWIAEHHFTDYTMSPDVLQFLSYIAGRTEHIRLGSMVIVLPWHDPVRVAEQISLIDHLSNGRFILGLGRGLGNIEYGGFRVDQNEGRKLFVEYAELVLNALENGYIEGGETIRQPRRDIRPSPARSFRGRSYAASVSPESAEIMAKLGVGLLVIPQKPWEEIREDFDNYHRVWKQVNGSQPAPKPLSLGFFFVDEDKARAEDLAMKYIGDYWKTALEHYEMTSKNFAKFKGYEYYQKMGETIAQTSLDELTKGFANLMPWGTPDEVLEKCAFIRDTIDATGLMCAFSYGGMPYHEAERNMKCFAEHVLPVIKTWDTGAMPIPAEINSPARAAIG